MGHSSPRAALAFVIGTGRCGSTLFADLLALSRNVGFVSNYDDRFGIDPMGLGRLWYQSAKWGTQRKTLLPHPSEAYNVIAREISPALVAPPRDLLASDASPYLRQRTAQFFTRRADRQGVASFLHKFTGWPRARFLNEVFPTAKFVHVVRDGRAVANSLVQQRWWSGFGGPDRWHYGALSPDDYEFLDRSGNRFEVLAALQWKLLIKEFEACADEIDSERWMTVRYEDVVKSPLEELERVLTWLNVAPDGSLMNRARAISINSARVGSYKVDLSQESLRYMESALNEGLRTFGYI